MAQASAASKAGAGGSFLQTTVGATRCKLSVSVEARAQPQLWVQLGDVQRHFFDTIGDAADGCEAPCGAVDSQDTRQSELDKTTAEEEGAIKSLDASVAAEEKQSTLWP